MPIRFPTTRWSLVARVAGGAGDARDLALSELLTRYLSPLKAYLVRGRKISPDRADDLLQGFVASKVLEKAILSRADAGKGQFRAFLISALGDYVVEQRRYDGRAKRSAGGEVVSLDFAPEVADPTGDPRVVFDVEWARQVLAEALDQMKTQCLAGDRRDLWTVFDGRVVGPTLEQTPPVPYAELVLSHGLKSAEQASNLLVTAKRLFRRCLRAVVRGYSLDEAEVDEEIADLERILTHGRV